MSVPFTIVDVFSTTPYKGNPLAIVDNTADALTTTQLKLITRQFNLSETTFFSPPTVPEANYHLRSFLPNGREVFGAGHNILGAWWYLADSGRLNFSKPQSVDKKTGIESFTFHQELGGDVIPVEVIRQKKATESGDGGFETSISMRQAPPHLRAAHPDPAALAAAVGLATEDIGFSDNPTLQPRVLSTSTTRHLLVPVKSATALDRVDVQREKLLEQLRLVDEKSYGIYLFTPLPSSGTTGVYQARFFSPGMSGEDPATGSAAGPLSAYLYKNGLLPLVDGVGKIEVHQGAKVGRECIINVVLTVAGTGSEEVLSVDFIGGGVKIADGQLIVPGSLTSF